MPVSQLSNATRILDNDPVVVAMLDYLPSLASTLLAQELILPTSAAFAERLIPSLDAGMSSVCPKACN